jgi:hypothetical protein
MYLLIDVSCVCLLFVSGAKTLLYCALLPADVSSPRGEFVSKNAVQSLTFYSDYEFISDYFVRKDA